MASPLQALVGRGRWQDYAPLLSSSLRVTPKNLRLSATDELAQRVVMIVAARSIHPVFIRTFRILGDDDLNGLRAVANVDLDGRQWITVMRFDVLNFSERLKDWFVLPSVAVYRHGRVWR